MPLQPPFGRPRRLLLAEISDICECKLERTPDNRLRKEQIRPAQRRECQIMSANGLRFSMRVSVSDQTPRR